MTLGFEESSDWGNIFYRIGQQLPERKNLIIKRTLLVSLPALLFIAVAGVMPVQFLGIFLSLDDLEGSGLIYFVLIFLIVLFYTIILSSIFKTEKILWLRSAFSGVPISPQESWRIALHFFPSLLSLNCRLFVRYYVWPLVSVVIFTYLSVRLFLIFGVDRIGLWLLNLSILFFALTLTLWYRYLRLRLSYAIFLFLDRSGTIREPGFWQNFFTELRNLHKISKGEEFHKNVALEVGGEIGLTTIEAIVRGISRGTATLGRSKVFALVGVFIGRGAAEISRQVLGFAQLTARFILYRSAFRKLHGFLPMSDQRSSE